ncbi:hypothetical protein JX265_000658 [Neoarthrinium moseri]|uniref:Rhodopsin domain-containing protein n=1 Tax=Neoarthrinium moseri TaxID=1658444 RepID=A0A9P9WZ65_9PEZI|nr:hypothetical protein JX265_000658 [Neoarthrinium moseri]
MINLRGVQARASSSSLYGQELIDLAWTQQPIETDGLGRVLSVVVLVLLTLSTIAVSLRVFVRGWLLRRDRLWGLDDTLSVLSYLTFLPSCVFILLATRFGLGTPDDRLTAPLKARAALYMGYWQMHYAASVNLVKAGIAVALLRLTIQRRYRYAIWAILVSAPVFTLGVVIVLVTTCHPVGAQFDLDLGPCPAHDLMAQLSYLFTVFTVILDWACAIIPYLLLRKLEMRRYVKVSLVIVLTMGGFASTAAIVRLPYLKYYRTTEDQLFENGVGLIAASLPPIRKLFGYYGDTDQMPRRVERAGAIETIGGTPFSKYSTTQLRILTPKPRSSGQWDRLDETSSSQERISYPL